MAPIERENPIERVDRFLEGLRVEAFVAVFLSNWDPPPGGQRASHWCS